jgi:hypothetical protein
MLLLAGKEKRQERKDTQGWELLLRHESRDPRNQNRAGTDSPEGAKS